MAILTRIYRVDNVLSVSKIVRESTRTDQIQRTATFRNKTAQTSSKKPTTGPAHFSHVEKDGATKVLSADEQRVKSLNDQAKRLKQQAKQMKAQDAVKKAQAQVQKLSGRV
jgi:hypothetical protein